MTLKWRNTNEDINIRWFRFYWDKFYKFRQLGQMGKNNPKAKAYKSNVMSNQDFEKVLETYGLLF